MRNKRAENSKTGSQQTYFRPDEIHAHAPERLLSVNEFFTRKVDAEDYPCVGAKSALHTEQYRFGLYGTMGKEETTSALGRDLRKYIQETTATESQYMSMIAVFQDEVHSEQEFENKLWQQLQSLHNSEKAYQKWDPAVASDPQSDDFSFSFNGTAFFIVGLHPSASRAARRFGYTAMAFNLHRQFEQLRESDRYEKMKQVIRKREIDYEGSINPMLSDHGSGSEAAQYSGRKVDKAWKCPFHS